MKTCRSQIEIFDLSRTTIPKNNRICVIWVLKKKSFYGWKYLFTWGRHIPKTSIFEKVSLLNCDLWSVPKMHSQKQQNLGYFSQKEKNTSLMLLKIPFYVLFYMNFPVTANNCECFETEQRIVLVYAFENTFKIATAKYIFVTLFLSNCDLWFISNRILQKQKKLRFLRPNKRNPYLIE